MFAYFIRIIFELLDRTEELLDRAEHHRRDAYLSSSADIFELERRMRQIEAADQAVTAEPDRDFRTDGRARALILL